MTAALMSSTLARRSPGMSAGSPGLQSVDEYTRNYQNAQSGIVGLVNELMKRGVTYEQLGQLPVSGDWAQESLATGNQPAEMLQHSPNLARFQQETPGYFGQIGLQGLGEMPRAGGETAGGSQAYAKPLEQQQQELLQRALGSSMAASDKDTNASGLMTAMYGGPLWTALARMGAGGEGLQGQIQQHFDPWINLRNGSLQSLYQAQQSQPTAQDIQNWEAARPGQTWQPAAPMAQPVTPPSTYWNDLGQQYAQQHDPYTQQLAQYIQSLQGLQGGLGQVTQGLQQQETAGLDPAIVQALQHNVDIWLVVILVAMVLSKIITRIYGNSRL